MQRICGNCVFCLIGISGERVCSLYGQEDISTDENGNWIAGRLVNPEEKCHHNDGKAFKPVEPMVDEAKSAPGWCRKPNSRILLEEQEVRRIKEILPSLLDKGEAEIAIFHLKYVLRLRTPRFMKAVSELDSIESLLSAVEPKEASAIRQILKGGKQ